MLLGPPDSGKTSWFCPLQGKLLISSIILLLIVKKNSLYHVSFDLGIIPSMRISGVVTDGRFSSSSINEMTQVVLMEEWTSNSLSCEEAKRTLQGMSVLFVH